jgi:DegV family protein with EDD domain
MKKPIALLIDSATSYEQSFLEKNDIFIIPLSIRCDDKYDYFDFGDDDTRKKILNLLSQNVKFKTSATPLGKMLTKIQELYESYENIIFLPISSGLSSQYSQAQIIKQEFPNNFYIINSTNAGIANELVLKKVIKWKNQNMNLSEIIEKANLSFNNFTTLFSCELLDGMTSGGRITKLAIKVFNVFKLKPIILLDGSNHYAGAAKNYQNVILKIIKKIKNKYYEKLKNEDVLNIGVHYTDFPKEKLDYIINTLSTEFNFPKEKIITR